MNLNNVLFILLGEVNNTEQIEFSFCENRIEH